MAELEVWGFRIPDVCLTQEEASYLLSLPREIPDVQWIWNEMDRVWDEMGLDNREPLKQQPVDRFYSHPIWLVNGIFCAVDPESHRHRQAIAQYINTLGPGSIVDYGGGFGELAKAVVEQAPETRVIIIEPFPSSLGQFLIRQRERIDINPGLEGRTYDLAVAQDVLEHVEDPIGLAYQLASSVKEDGYVVFANCFYPVIKCHLPSTFHLRFTFPSIMKRMGLRYLGTIRHAVHAQVFQRCGQLQMDTARLREKQSRRKERMTLMIDPVYAPVRRWYWRLRHMAGS